MLRAIGGSRCGASGLGRLTLGSICSFRPAMNLMEHRLGRRNPISEALREAASKSVDGRRRFRSSLRIRMYRHMIRIVRELRPDLEVGICLEELPVVDALRTYAKIGKCNCVL